MQGHGGKPIVLEYEQIEGGGFLPLAYVLGCCCRSIAFASSFPFTGQGPEDLGPLFVERGSGIAKP